MLKSVPILVDILASNATNGMQHPCPQIEDLASLELLQYADPSYFKEPSYCVFPHLTYTCKLLKNW